MNIFNVLSQGKSRLHEPSISAMLGYLLSPNEDHGLGDTFLREFFELLNIVLEEQVLKKQLLDKNLISVNVELEVQYNYKKRSDIDIQISIIDKRSSKEIHRIIIENKIKVGAANPKQLATYYKSVIKDEDFNLENPKLTIVFLTPKSENKRLQSEYENLNRTIDSEHNCAWIYWTDEDNDKCVLGIIKEILKKELYSEINPINEYMRHTLKAFVRFVESVTTQNTGEVKQRRGQDIGDVIDDVTITMKNGEQYRIIRRDSSQIQVYNVATDEKEVARHVMSQFIDEQKLDIPHNELNTRSIGRKLLEILLKSDFVIKI